MTSTTIQNAHCSTYLRANAHKPTKLRALVKASRAGTVELVNSVST